MVRITQTYKAEGEPFLYGELLDRSYAELPDLQDQDLALFRWRLESRIMEHTRIEIMAYDGDRCVGCLVAGVEEDIHYGICMVALVQYVDPEYRPGSTYRRMFRMFVQAAKDTGMVGYIYTHRVGPGKFLHTYRSV